MAKLERLPFSPLARALHKRKSWSCSFAPVRDDHGGREYELDVQLGPSLWKVGQKAHGTRVRKASKRAEAQPEQLRDRPSSAIRPETTRRRHRCHMQLPGHLFGTKSDTIGTNTQICIPVMKTTFTVTKRPRSFVGLSSEMKRGAMQAATPTPIPIL